MLKVTLVFDGGSRGNPGAGYGSYAVIRNNQQTVTHLEFGRGMTAHEAEYDTLITALETLSRQENVAHLALDIHTTSQLILNQLKGTWKAKTGRLLARRDRTLELLAAFKSYTLHQATPDFVRRSTG